MHIKVTDKQIREYLGHNGIECRVRIARTGRVSRYGSSDVTDRGKDFWAYAGERTDIAKAIAWEAENA